MAYTSTVGLNQLYFNESIFLKTAVCDALPLIHSMGVYDLLWDKNKDIAEQTLQVPFLQHMQLGDLQADHYVNFTIQDINYLLRVTDMLEEMCEKVKAPEDLHQFMQDRYDSYKKYALDTLQQFNLKVRNQVPLISISHIEAKPKFASRPLFNLCFSGATLNSDPKWYTSFTQEAHHLFKFEHSRKAF